MAEISLRILLFKPVNKPLVIKCNQNISFWGLTIGHRRNRGREMRRITVKILWATLSFSTFISLHLPKLWFFFLVSWKALYKFKPLSLLLLLFTPHVSIQLISQTESVGLLLMPACERVPMSASMAGWLTCLFICHDQSHLKRSVLPVVRADAQIRCSLCCCLSGCRFVFELSKVTPEGVIGDYVGPSNEMNSKHRRPRQQCEPSLCPFDKKGQTHRCALSHDKILI